MTSDESADVDRLSMTSKVTLAIVGVLGAVLIDIYCRVRGVVRRD